MSTLGAAAPEPDGVSTLGAAAPEPMVTYVAITPDGAVRLRTVENRIEPDASWGTLYQVELWAAVHGEVDPHRGEVNGVALAGGMRGKVADAADRLPRLYPPNPLASALLGVLQAPPRTWRGTIVIVGRENEEGLTASLTAEQHAAIADAYRSITAA